MANRIAIVVIVLIVLWVTGFGALSRVFLPRRTR
jgi:hypothetical protein